MAKKIKLNRLKHLNIDQAVIDADAAAILQSAAQAVSKIIARRAEMDANGQKEKPLIVLAGEDHVLPAVGLHHVALLDQLRHTEPATVFTYELSHDFDKNFKKLLNIDTAHLSTEDKSRWLLSSYLDYCSTAFSNYSKKVLFNFCLRQKIPFRTTDTSIRNLRLDKSDPSTQESLEACSRTKSWLSRIFTGKSGPDATHPKGMHARNYHMVKASLAFAEETGSRILVQHCGSAHVSGTKKHPFNESLLALFEKAGHRAVSVYASKDADHDVSDLPPWRARYDWMVQAYPDWTDFKSEKEEKTYLDAMLVTAKMGKHRFTPERKKEAGRALIKLAYIAHSPGT